MEPYKQLGLPALAPIPPRASKHNCISPFRSQGITKAGAGKGESHDLSEKFKFLLEPAHQEAEIFSLTHSTTNCTAIAHVLKSTVVKLVMPGNDKLPNSTLKERIVECR